MSILSDSAILKGIETGDIQISPFKREHLNTNSYDLTLGNYIKVYKEFWNAPYEGAELELRPLDPKKDNPTVELIIPETGMILKPGFLYLGHTNEIAGTKTYHPQLKGKSSLGRLGISIDCTASWGETGFANHWTLEIHVIRPVIVYPNMRFAQIGFSTVEGEVLEPYDKKVNSKYNGDNKAKESLYYLNYQDNAS